MADAANVGRHGIAVEPPGGARRAACSPARSSLASSVIFLALAPFAKLPLAPLPAFIPIYQSALIINDVITVVFLLGQRQFRRSNALASSPAAIYSPR